MKIARILKKYVLLISNEMSPYLDISGLGAEPDDVGAHEDHAGAHDGEERPEGHVRLQRLQSRALQGWKSFIFRFFYYYGFCLNHLN